MIFQRDITSCFTWGVAEHLRRYNKTDMISFVQRAIKELCGEKPIAIGLFSSLKAHRLIKALARTKDSLELLSLLRSNNDLRVHTTFGPLSLSSLFCSLSAVALGISETEQQESPPTAFSVVCLTLPSMREYMHPDKVDDSLISIYSRYMFVRFLTEWLGMDVLQAIDLPPSCQLSVGTARVELLIPAAKRKELETYLQDLNHRFENFFYSLPICCDYLDVPYAEGRVSSDLNKALQQIGFNKDRKTQARTGFKSKVEREKAIDDYMLSVSASLWDNDKVSFANADDVHLPKALSGLLRKGRFITSSNSSAAHGICRESFISLPGYDSNPNISFMDFADPVILRGDISGYRHHLSRLGVGRFEKFQSAGFSLHNFFRRDISRMIYKSNKNNKSYQKAILLHSIADDVVIMGSRTAVETVAKNISDVLLSCYGIEMIFSSIPLRKEMTASEISKAVASELLKNKQSY